MNKKLLIITGTIIFILFGLFVFLPILSFFTNGGKISQAQNCISAGGWPKYYALGDDNCKSNPNEQSHKSRFSGCDCGIKKCFDGKKCIINQSFINPYTKITDETLIELNQYKSVKVIVSLEKQQINPDNPYLMKDKTYNNKIIKELDFTPQEFKLSRVYTAFPGFSGTILQQSALDKLDKHPNIMQVREDFKVYPLNL